MWGLIEAVNGTEPAVQQPLLNWMVIVGIALVFIGMFLIMVGFLQPILTAAPGGVRGEGGAVIVIGPFPILVATSERAAKILAVLAIILMALALLLFLAPYLLLRKAAGAPAP